MSQIICSAIRRNLLIWSKLRQGSRHISATATAGAPKATDAVKSPAHDASASAQLPSDTHKVENMERKILVWAGNYKNADEVPNYIDPIVMERARSRIRIRTTNYLIAMLVIACTSMYYIRNSERKDLMDKKEVSSAQVAAEKALPK